MPCLSWLFYDNKQLDVAETAASRSSDFLETGEQFRGCQLSPHPQQYISLKGRHREGGRTLGRGSPDGFVLRLAQSALLGPLLASGALFLQGIFDEAHTHIECAKPRAIDDLYPLGCVMELHAGFWYNERSIEVEKLEAMDRTGDLERPRDLQQGSGCFLVCNGHEYRTGFSTLQSDDLIWLVDFLDGVSTQTESSLLTSSSVLTKGSTKHGTKPFWKHVL